MRPPVCKIMDFGKYKYEQNKKAHESKVKQHKTKLKTVRLRPKTDPHMLEIRVARRATSSRAGTRSRS